MAKKVLKRDLQDLLSTAFDKACPKNGKKYQIVINSINATIRMDDSISSKQVNTNKFIEELQNVAGENLNPIFLPTEGKIIIQVNYDVLD